MERVAQKVLLTTRNGRRGRRKASVRQNQGVLSAEALLLPQSRNHRQRRRKSFPIWKHGSTQPSSRESPTPTRCSKPNVPNSKTRQLPATVPGFSPLTRKWKRHKPNSTRSTRVGLSWNEKTAEHQ